MSFTLGDWLVEPSLHRISKSDTSRRLEPKVMELLLVLAERPGDVFTKEEISERLWPGIFVSESSVFRHVSELRRLLGDDRRRPKYVATIPKKGYRLVAPISTPEERKRGASSVFPRVAALAAASILVLVVVSSRTTPRAVAPAAYAAFLKGDLYENRIDCDSFDRSLDLYREAMAADAGFAATYPKLLDALFATAILGCRPPGPLFTEAASLLERARNDAGEGALALWRDQNLDEALRRFHASRDEAGDLSYAMALIASGRDEEGVLEARRCLEELPVDLGENWAMGAVLYFVGRDSEAIEQLQATLELYPGFRPAMQLLALSSWMNGDSARALELAAKSEPGEEDRLNRFDAIPGYLFGAAGDAGRARGNLALWQKRAEREWVPKTSLALLHLALGERQDAERWLEKARQERDPWLVLVERDPAFRAFLSLPVSGAGHSE